jgi:poly-gamma-glutamate synthase PgsB/CapB
MLILLILFTGLLLAGTVELWAHKRKIKQIPYRVHVNGTRGKSSVTRLISAALRAGGRRVFAKTTGTLPQMIFPDGSELPVYRASKANIIEQLRIFRVAAENEAEVLVIECMALQPTLQSLCELKLVQATHGVITNARADHLDVMGPDEVNVAEALLGTTPVGQKLFTCERDYLKEFQTACDDRGSELVAISLDEANEISDEEMLGFSYVEHKDNVALALSVAKDFGIEREVALKGMYEVTADIGALHEFSLDYFGRTLILINGFAANDPESTEMIWDIALARHDDAQQKVMIINCRADRPDRSRQMGECIAGWAPADYYVVIGSGVYPFMQGALESGISPNKLVYAERMSGVEIFEKLLSISTPHTMFMGICNIKGPGLELIQFFKNRSISTVIGR